MAQKKTYVIVHKQYGNPAAAFKKVYPFTSHMKAAKRMGEMLKEAEKNSNYVSPVHFTEWGQFKGYHPMNIDSFHVSTKHGNEQYVELLSVNEGEELDV